MIYYLVTVLIFLWMVGVLTGNFYDGYIHLLLLGVIAVMTVQYVTDRRWLE